MVTGRTVRPSNAVRKQRDDKYTETCVYKTPLMIGDTFHKDSSHRFPLALLMHTRGGARGPQRGPQRGGQRTLGRRAFDNVFGR
jgi:hypothetical protein